MIKVINSRRRLLNHKTSYKSPHVRSRRFSQKTHEERVKLNQERKKAKLDKIKAKNKPKKKRPQKVNMPYRFKYYNFKDYNYRNDLYRLEHLEKIDED